MTYGKRCVCGHGKQAHYCIERKGNYKFPTLEFMNCNCGCHGVIRSGKEGKHEYKICGCNEYKTKEENK